MRVSIYKAAAAAIAVMLGAVSSASALTNPTLLYSFENPPGDPNGPLDGFTANQGTAVTTLSQSTIGATNGSNSLLFAQSASETFSGALNATVPAALNDPATTAVSFDITVPAGGQFTGTFANMGITEFATDNNNPSNMTPVSFQSLSQQNVSLSVGTHRVVVYLEYVYNPDTYDTGPNDAGVPFSSLMGTGANHYTPTSFEFFVNKGGTTNGPLNLYIDNIQTITASGWDIDSSGDWNNANNWYGGTPNSIGAEADFIDPVGATGNDTINLATAVTVGILHFNNFNPHTLSGAGSLTLQASSGSASIAVDLAAAEGLSVPVTFASSTVLNVATNATLTFSSPVIVNSGKSVTPTGGGLETYTSNITLQSGASITFANTTQANVLSLTTGSVASITPHGANPKILLGVGGLTFGGSTNNWQGKLDVADNDLIVHSGIISQIANQIKTAFNAPAGYWNGSGITSTIAAGDTRHLTALGYRTGGSPLDGVNTVATDVLVKYTYYGDANLDGVVNGADYQQIDAGFGSHLTGWQNGDFNYDGVVDGTDFSLIDNTFNQTLASSSAPLAIIASSADLTASPQVSVPEPTTLGLLSIGTIGLLARRRRIQN